jgi:hypothetical protein
VQTGPKGATGARSSSPGSKTSAGSRAGLKGGLTFPAVRRNFRKRVHTTSQGPPPPVGKAGRPLSRFLWRAGATRFGSIARLCGRLSRVASPHCAARHAPGSLFFLVSRKRRRHGCACELWHVSLLTAPEPASRRIRTNPAARKQRMGKNRGRTVWL